MSKYLEDEPYCNRHQRELVEHLHKRTKFTAVAAGNNSLVDAFLTRDALSRVELLRLNDGKGSPYRIERVHPLPDSDTFECKVTFSADWSEVDDA